MSRSPFLCIFALSVVTGCANDDKPPVCGESFCFPNGTKLISKTTPVEDFNLYRVENSGERFLIYEGNHPQRHRGSVLISVGRDWPNYLEVNGSCASDDDCAVRSFAARIALR